MYERHEYTCILSNKNEKNNRDNFHERVGKIQCMQSRNLSLSLSNHTYTTAYCIKKGLLFLNDLVMSGTCVVNMVFKVIT